MRCLSIISRPFNLINIERRSAVAAKVFSFSNLGLLAGPAFNFVLGKIQLTITALYVILMYYYSAFFDWKIGPIEITPLNGAGLLMAMLLVAGLIFILSCFEGTKYSCASLKSSVIILYI